MPIEGTPEGEELTGSRLRIATDSTPAAPKDTDPGPRRFVGRVPEMAQLRRALQVRSAVVVTGGAGVGKTRLARELVAQIAPAEEVGLATASRSAAEVPLGALAPLLPPVPRAAPDVGLVQRAVDAVLAHAVVLVDDAHHLDGVSAAVLHQAATRGGTRLVLTVRSDVAVPDAVTVLWKDGAAERLDLGPLSAESTTALAEALLEGTLDPAARRRLFAVTGGNALWLRLLVEGERAAGRLRRSGDSWSWSGQPALSSALEDLLAGRIGALTATQRHVLELLALGEPLGLVVLEELAGALAVEDVAQRGLIAVRAEGARREVRLGHPLYGEAVRARMSVPRRRRVRGQLADALLATGARRAGDQLRQAVLDLDSDRDPDPDLLCRAAGQAVGLGDVELGERLFRAARDAGGGFEAQIGLSHIVMWMHRGDEADGEMARAVGAARTPAERSRAVQARAGNLYFNLVRPAEAVALLDAAGADGTATDDLDGLRALLAMVHNEFGSAETLAARVLGAADTSSQARTYAGWAQVGVRAFGGRGAPLSPAVNTVLGTAGASLDTAALGPNIAFFEVVGLCLEGRIGPARDTADRLRAGQGDVVPALFAAFLDGRIAVETGHARTARRLLVSLRPYFPGAGGGFTAWIELMVAAAAGMSGDADDADDALERARQAEHPGMAALGPQLLWARAWASAARGATAEALSTLARAAGLAARSRQHAVEVLVRHTAVCFGDRTQQAPLTALSHLLDSPRAHAAAAHAAAWAARDPGALDDASRTLEALELLLPAADAAAQASVLHASAGALPPAAAAAQRAARLTLACDGARTPASLAATSPVVVSAREREVATLAAAGLTNREIAERLHVSLRTVESHIYRACSRLGLSGRSAFVATVVPTTDPGREVQ